MLHQPIIIYLYPKLITHSVVLLGIQGILLRSQSYIAPTHFNAYFKNMYVYCTR